MFNSKVFDKIIKICNIILKTEETTFVFAQGADEQNMMW